MEDIENKLIKLYIEQELSTRDIAKVLNISQTQVRRLLKDWEIPVRSSQEGKKTKHFKNKEEEINRQISNTLISNSLKKGNSHVLVCSECNSEFITRTKSSQKFCCNKCRIKYLEYKKLYTAINPHECKYCKKTIYGKHIICSDCDLSIRKYNIQKLRKYIITYCAYCGEELHVIPSVYKQNTNHYCNQNCMSNYYALFYTGENSPTWKGGKRHYSGSWLRQRNLARDRDNYTCQLCGVSESTWHKEMDVHHIINYREFTDKYEANKLDNLVCLCNKCHSFVHSNLNIDHKFIKNKI